MQIKIGTFFYLDSSIHFLVKSRDNKALVVNMTTEFRGQTTFADLPVVDDYATIPTHIEKLFNITFPKTVNLNLES